MDNAKRDENRVTTLIAVSSADGITPVVLYADPITHRLLVEATGTGSSPLTTKGDIYVFGSSNSRLPVGTDGQVLVADSTQTLGVKWQTAGAGTGDVVGPASATDNAIARFDLATGKLIQNSGVTISDTNVISTAGLIDSSLTASQLLGTNGSKQLISLTTATYPSLAELAYVKGVTSAIQTQLNAKQGTITTGTTAQYFRGDLSLATFPTALSSFTNDSGFITSSALSPYALLSGTLAQFAATTSAQLATVISDETGSGALVFGTSPTITTLLTVSNTTDTSSNQVLLLKGTRATPTAGDYIYQSFSLNNASAASKEVGRIAAFIDIVTAGSENGRLRFYVSNSSGAITAYVDITSGALRPVSNDGTSLGISTASWSDLFLASGGVINWNNGDYTLTHATGILTASKDFRITSANVGTNADSVPTLSSASTLTNKTLTTPKFVDTGYIADNSGNEYLKFSKVASAVNEITIKNNSIGNAPEIQSTGDDTNIDLKLVPKGTGIVKGTRHYFQIRLKDSTTALTTGTSIGGDFRISPSRAITIKAVGAYVDTAPTGASLLTIDINEAGTTILSTKITLDASEKTSTTAATAPVISDATIAADAVVTFDIDQVGSTVAGSGLVVWIEYEYA